VLITGMAVGRKNYLFAGSDKGAERLAIGYTVFASCRMHGVDPLAWATDVIRKLQDDWPRSHLGRTAAGYVGEGAAGERRPRRNQRSLRTAEPTR
jgi:hypothetical protein